MQLIDITRVRVEERQRRSFPPAAQRELEDTNLKRGLLQPPGGYFDAETQQWVLVWGERRLKAIQSIQARGQRFICDGQDIDVGLLPWLTLNEVTTLGVAETELEENLIRLDLDWQDRTRALAKIHQLRLAANPTQTLRQTAEEVLTTAGGAINFDGSDSTHPHRVALRLAEAVRIAEHLDNPIIEKARNAKEAHALILKHEEEKWRSMLVRRQLARGSSEPHPIEILHDDALSLLPRLEAGTFDLILTDPPYGIDASSGGFRSRSVHHHNYSDTTENARALALSILTEGFRLTTPRANLFIFCHPRLWNWLYDTAANMGWTPYPVPIVWQKSESEGLAPWGSQGFRRTYDSIFYATKGRKGLISSPTDILHIKRVPRHERIHAAEKPVELLRILIECSTLPGDSVLDPCAGSGSTLVAARECGRRALGIEKDATYFNTALANIHGGSDATSSIIPDNA